MPRRDTGLVVLGTIDVLGLSAWIGGLIVIVAAVIPAVFNSGIGMEPGGRLLTRVFEGYNGVVGGVIGVLVATALIRAWLGEPAGRGRTLMLAEGGLLALMVALYAMIVFWLGPQTVALQEEAFAAKSVEAKTSAYEAFFRVHTIARALYSANVGLAIALLAVKVKGWAMR